MSLLSEALKKRFAELDVHSSIHRHSPLGMAEELQNLSQSIIDTDSRDSYGRAGSIASFEQQLSDLFEQPDCVFLPTGTLAQCAALKCYSEQTGRFKVGLHPTSHLLLHEHRAIETLWGLDVMEMGSCQKVLTSDDVRQLDPNATAAIIVETPMREIGGKMPNWEELVSMQAWCREHKIKMHLDGARIWQCTEFYGRSLADIASLFDSLYVSFYKDLGGIFGAALFGSVEFIEQARIWARRAGGNPMTLYPEVIAARNGLSQYLPKMPQFIHYTKQLGEELRSLPLGILPERPACSMFHIRFNLGAEALASKIVSYAEKTGILVLPLPRSGNTQECVCEIAIGDRAIAHAPEFWCKHIAACLAQEN
jgi:threonine aldolase